MAKPTAAEVAAEVADSIPGATPHGARVRFLVSFTPQDALRVAEAARRYGRATAAHMALLALTDAAEVVG
jgi:hypothetical protein